MKRLFFYLLAGILVLVAGSASAQTTFSVLGDSYSTFKGYMPEGYANYYPDHSKDVKSLEQTWWKLLETKMGWKLDTNNSWSGSTICTTGYSGNDYTHEAFVTRTALLGHPDVILILGGTNDAWADSPIGEYKYDDITVKDLKSFRPAMACMLQKLAERYPESKIVFILNYNLKAEVDESVNTICTHYGVPVIELDSFDMENGHPTVKGMEQVAAQIAEGLEEILK
ncbi:MAG: SGNH/GDSL hydrolase family protein [Bacteroidaceae bacterium]|nr:SGNH/GDSL hydrolase family protein [Bacteroidaceae bacterium]